MDSILDAPSARQQSYRLSVEFYHQLGDLGFLKNDVELLDGFLIKKMPKSPLHSSVSQCLIEALRCCAWAGLVIRQEQPITTANSEPEPDVAVVKGALADYTKKHPRTAELVIEVSINTEEIDLRKAAIYSEASVKEYWVVEPQTKKITVFRSPKGRAYEQTTVYEGAQTVVCAALPGFAVSLPALFAS